MNNKISENFDWEYSVPKKTLTFKNTSMLDIEKFIKKISKQNEPKR